MQIFGGAKDFCPNFPKLTWKKLQRKWPPKKTVHLFKSKHNSSTIVELAQISPNLSENSKIKTWPPKEKNVCTLILGAIFVKSKHIPTAILQTFSKFCQNFHRFCPDFHQIKNFGGVLAPPTLTPVTLTEPHYMFCGTPVEKHWPTLSGVLVNTTVLMLLLKSFAGKKMLQPRRFS